MSVVRAAAALLLGAAGGAMMVAGPVMAAHGVKARTEIQAELCRQSISFPAWGCPLSSPPTTAGRS